MYYILKYGVCSRFQEEQGSSELQRRRDTANEGIVELCHLLLFAQSTEHRESFLRYMHSIAVTATENFQVKEHHLAHRATQNMLI